MDDEDDRMSIRSGVSAKGGAAPGQDGEGSGASGSSGASGHITAKGRSRATSSASSVRTARGRTGADDDLMEVDEGPLGNDVKGKGKETDVPLSSTAVKRQRTRAPSLLGPGVDRSPRRRSTFQAPSNTGSLSVGFQPTLSTTTADDLMPSMKKKPDRAASISSASTSTKSLTRPLQSSTSASTLRPSRSPSIHKSSSRSFDLASTSASGPEQPLLTSPSDSLAPSQRSGQSSLARRGWFGRAPMLDAASAGHESNAQPTATSDGPAARSAPDKEAASASGEEVQSSASTAHAPQPADRDVVESVVVAIAPPARGWLSLLARATPSSLNLAAQARGEESTPASVGMQTDESGPVEADETTPPATPRAAPPGESVRDVLRAPSIDPFLT